MSCAYANTLPGFVLCSNKVNDILALININFYNRNDVVDIRRHASAVVHCVCRKLSTGVLSRIYRCKACTRDTFPPQLFKHQMLTRMTDEKMSSKDVTYYKCSVIVIAIILLCCVMSSLVDSVPGCPTYIRLYM